MRSPLRRESEYRDERNASWVEHAEVDEYDIDSQADEEVEDDKDDEAAVKTDPRAKRYASVRGKKLCSKTYRLFSS